MIRLQALPAYVLLAAAYYTIGQQIAHMFAAVLQSWQSLGR